MSTIRDYIPFGRPSFSQAEIDAVTSVMRKGWVGMGPEVIAFETELAQYLKVPHVVTVNSCTSALHLSLLTHGISEGDEVICPSLTWCSTANAALYLRAKPVFCDVDPGTMSMNAETVKAKLTDKTRAVVVVHYGGYPVDVEEIRQVLPPHVKIVEDAAHALGASYATGNKVGASGNATCFSFYANKNLATGEGGAIALFDEEQALKIRSLRQHALPVDAWMRFTHPKNVLLSNQLSELGFKANYTDLQASIGRVQLRRYEELQFIRKSIAAIYVDRLSKALPEIGFQDDILSERHARHLFVVRLPDGLPLTREGVILSLRNRNVGATIHYTPLHTMPVYPKTEGHLPNVERLQKQILTLPISASMSEDDAIYVTNQVKEILQ